MEKKELEEVIEELYNLWNKGNAERDIELLLKITMEKIRKKEK